MNNNHQKFEQAKRQFQTLMTNAPRIAGVTAVAFFKEGFRREGQLIDGKLVPWKKRKFEFSNRKGAAILKKTGALQRDLKFKTRKQAVAITSNLPYSKILNDGGKVPITPRMRRFFWAKYKEATGKTVFNIKTKQVTKSTSRYSADAEIWKALALTKKTHLDVEARPFLYNSKDLINALNTAFEGQIKAIFQ